MPPCNFLLAASLTNFLSTASSTSRFCVVVFLKYRLSISTLYRRIANILLRSSFRKFTVFSRKALRDRITVVNHFFDFLRQMERFSPLLFVALLGRHFGFCIRHSQHLQKISAVCRWRTAHSVLFLLWSALPRRPSAYQASAGSFTKAERPPTLHAESERGESRFKLNTPASAPLRQPPPRIGHRSSAPLLNQK